MMLFLENYANIIGIVGVAMVLWAYCLIQLNQIDQNAVSFSLINLIGSFFILISLYFHPNLASVVIELAWFLISSIGLVKAIRRTKARVLLANSEQ